MISCQNWSESNKALMDETVRVMVVDDEPDVAATLAEALALDGYEVRIASDGNEAILLVQTFHPHCVLFDIDMPGLDGSELSERLRQLYGDDIVLIAMTGWSEKDRRVADTFARVDHYLQKPIELKALSKALPSLRS
jgi:CheY-like chemotaxis protein